MERLYVGRKRTVDDGVGDTYAGDVDGAGAEEFFEESDEEGHGSDSSRSASLSFRRAFLEKQRKVVKRGVTLPVSSTKRLTRLRR